MSCRREIRMIRTGALLGVTIAAAAYAILPDKAGAITVIALFAYSALCLLFRAENDSGRVRVFATHTQPLIPILIRRPNND